MSELAVELEGVSVSFRAVPVLEDVSLRVEPRDYVAVLGPNGGGKTTLLKVLLGLIAPDGGTARVLGRPPREARGRVGYVPQHFAADLAFPIRVVDVVLMGCLSASPWGRPSEAEVSVAHETLRRVEMDAHVRRPIGTLSGGELQRVLIARALAQRPALMLLDEPTSSLDERIGRNLWELFEELSKEMAVIVVSHDIGAVSKRVKTVACLNRSLHIHSGPDLTPELLRAVYGAPVDLVAHGEPGVRGDDSD